MKVRNYDEEGGYEPIKRKKVNGQKKKKKLRRIKPSWKLDKCYYSV